LWKLILDSNKNQRILDPPYAVWLEINLSHVEENVRAVADITHADVMAVVKANAYGYGAVAVARAALQAGASWLGVARLDEAIQLREVGLHAPILVLGMVPSLQVDAAIENDITLTLPGFEAAEVFSRRAIALGRPLKVHLKVDTGMGRIGVLPDRAPDLADFVLSKKGLLLDGIFSHLANADRMHDPLTAVQIDRFNRVLQGLSARGIRPRWVHLANSAAALSIPESHFNLVRIGQALVGHNPFSYQALPDCIKPILQAWKSHLVVCLPPSKASVSGYGRLESNEGERIGIVSVGYGDGFWRLPGNEVLIEGVRIPVIGEVDMEEMRVHLPREYPPGTQVVLVGSQGCHSISIEELAIRYNTGPGKITAIIPTRVPRVYVRREE
jgi:alanine racemase